MSARDDADFVNDVLPAFISEAQEQIAESEELLLQLEERPDDRKLLDALFRCTHTVKGSAGIFGLNAIVQFAHHVESLLERLRTGEIALDASRSDLLLRCNDELRQLVEAARNHQAGTPEGLDARRRLVEQLHQALGESQASTEAPAPADPVASPDAPAAASGRPVAAQVRASFHKDAFRNGTDPLSVLNYAFRIGPVTGLSWDTQAVPPLEALDPEDCHLAATFHLEAEDLAARLDAAFSLVRADCELQITPEVPAAVAAAAAPSRQTDAPPAEAATKTPTTAAPEGRLIRVQADRLDAVINLLGELVISGAGASALARKARNGTLVKANELVCRQIEEIRNATLQLRMVPIGETFSRFRRVVRDTAADLGKEVELRIVGGETELDKSIVEQIADPLMHLVRNALDHGMETPAERVAAGKAARGVLTLEAYHEAGGIIIRIVDDGRGINRRKVLERAWANGLVPRGVVPDDDDIVKLIFEAGFSTAERVTNLSGRGVGMDVVRRNVEALRGTIAVRSTEGEGTTMEIGLPLTLAIIDGFLVAVGATRFIFPLDCVTEVINSQRVPATLDERGRSCVELRGQVLPVVDLRALYELDSSPDGRRSVVVVKAGQFRFGVLVDELMGQHQTVIKPLGQIFRRLRSLSGSSILGSGEVALIIDVLSLGDLAAGSPTQDHTTAGVAA